MAVRRRIRSGTDISYTLFRYIAYPHSTLEQSGILTAGLEEGDRSNLVSIITVVLTLTVLQHCFLLLNKETQQ